MHLSMPYQYCSLLTVPLIMLTTPLLTDPLWIMLTVPLLTDPLWIMLTVLLQTNLD